MKITGFLIAAALGFPFLLSAGTGHFIQTKKLPGGGMVVVAEGELEPRSIGSYSVRLYRALNPDYPLDDFVTGMIRPRDGSVVKIALVQLTGTKEPELVVVIQSAGSGGYLTVEAFSVNGKALKLLALVRGLSPGADLAAELKKQVN